MIKLARPLVHLSKFVRLLPLKNKLILHCPAISWEVYIKILLEKDWQMKKSKSIVQNYSCSENYNHATLPPCNSEICRLNKANFQRQMAMILQKVLLHLVNPLLMLQYVYMAASCTKATVVKMLCLQWYIL